MTTPFLVAVVGGGITGLSTAYRLASMPVAENPPIDITLLEASDRWGGQLRTIRRGGFMLEAGAEGFVASRGPTMGLCAELGYGDAMVSMDRRRPPANALVDGKLYTLPTSIADATLDDPTGWVESGLLSEAGAARLAAEVDTPVRQDSGDESVRDFLVRRFGEEACERLFAPLMRNAAEAGVSVSADAVVPELRGFELRHGSVIQGFRKSRQAAVEAGHGAGDGISLAAPRDGLSTLADALVERLRKNPAVTLRAGAPVQSVIRVESGYSIEGAGETIEADAAVIALPAPDAADLLQRLDPALATELRHIQYRPAVTVTLVYRSDDIHDAAVGKAYIRVGSEPGDFSACIWEADRWSRTMPDGAQTLRLFLRESTIESLKGSDERLIELAKDDLRRIFDIKADPLLSEVCSWVPNGLPRYPVGHLARLDAMERLLALSPGLILAGASYRGSGVTDCVRDGERAAKLTLEVARRRRLARKRPSDNAN